MTKFHGRQMKRVGMFVKCKKISTSWLLLFVVLFFVTPSNAQTREVLNCERQWGLSDHPRALWRRIQKIKKQDPCTKVLEKRMRELEYLYQELNREERRS